MSYIYIYIYIYDISRLRVKMGIMSCLLLKVSLLEFQQKVLKGILDPLNVYLALCG